MEINCLKCEFSGRCGFFPVLSNWTGSCQIRVPRCWESGKDNKTINGIITSRVVDPVFFSKFNEVKKKESPTKTVFCGNKTCAKKGWCNDGIARHCKLFQSEVENNKERREECYNE